MRMDKLTSRFQQALADAQSLAVGRDHNMLEPAHVLEALLDQQGGSTAPMLAQAGVNVPLLRQRVGETLDALPSVKGQEGNINVSHELNRLLNVTDKLAQQRGDQFIASALFVLAAFFILLLLLHYSTVISTLADQNRILAQRLALLERRLEEERSAP